MEFNPNRSLAHNSLMTDLGLSEPQKQEKTSGVHCIYPTPFGGKKEVVRLRGIRLRLHPHKDNKENEKDNPFATLLHCEVKLQKLKAFVVMDIAYICADIGQDVRRKKCRKHIVYEGICPFDTHPPDTIADGVGIFP